MQGFYPNSTPVKYITFGINSELLDMTFPTQKSTNWCWASVTQAVYRLHDMEVDQEALATLYCGVDKDGRALDCPAPNNIITDALNHCGPSYCLKTQYYDKRPTIADLMQALKNKRPMVVVYRTGMPINHAVVITSFELYIDSEGFYQLGSITVRDPDPDPINKFLRGKKIYVDGEEFLNRVYSFWIPTVQRIPWSLQYFQEPLN